MNRCFQVISDACTASVARLAQRSASAQLNILNYKASLKQLIITDPLISVEITSPTQFEVFEAGQGAVIPDGPAIAEARLADFFLGADRVKRQYDAAMKLKEAGATSAWTLVTAYYCAYFASLELAKVANKFTISFEHDDLVQLSYKAVGADHAAFFADSPSNFSGTVYAGKLVFRSVGTRPHVAAWDNALYATRQILGNKDWPDAQKFVDLLANDNCNPSLIRNTWNYKRSDYFSSTGEAKAKEFKKILGNPSGAYSWYTQQRGRLPDLEPCVIAVLCEAFAGAVINAASRSKNLLHDSMRSAY